jgi:hypothetical protein
MTVVKMSRQEAADARSGVWDGGTSVVDEVA